MIKKMTAGVALMSAALLAGPSSHPRTLEQEVRHEILMVPYIGVFDNPTWQIDNGVVTLSGEVTQPVDKYNLEKAVKGVEGITRVENDIEVYRFPPSMTRSACIRCAPCCVLPRSANTFRACSPPFASL